MNKMILLKITRN